MTWRKVKRSALILAGSGMVDGGPAGGNAELGARHLRPGRGADRAAVGSLRVHSVFGADTTTRGLPAPRWGA
jgi:hypothetical protein